MERYESPTIEPVGGGEADPKSVVPIVVVAIFLVSTLYVAAGAIAVESVSYLHLANSAYQYSNTP
ncbi:MAG: hypothetical protein DRI22_02830 [Caldiserica bacterium]|nr:MAG: hypothetical protein DRI22_02830 [Caldisericota bacterium]RLD15259.1 MAG: hypothetical protein DRI28_01080 [Caldisericota bacterium]